MISEHRRHATPQSLTGIFEPMSQERGWFKWDFLLELSSPTGSETRLTLTERKNGAEAVSDFGEPFDPTELRSLSERIRLGQALPSVVREFGQALAGIAFPPRIAAKLHALAADGPVRLGLRFQPSDLADIPWECALVPRESGEPLAFHPAIHSFRLLERSVRSNKPRSLSKVLLALADPRSQDYPALANGEREIHAITQALATPECRNLQAITLRYATPASLARSLADHEPDVLHLICHGDVRASGGVLIMESDRPRRETILYADDFAKTVIASGVGLVVLSGCFTAGSLASAGAALVTAGLPAVVGMQTPISDTGALLFARAMYASLADGTPLEVGVDQGRTAASGSGLDWLAPIMMAAAAESPVFSVPVRAPRQTEPRHNIPLEERRFVGRNSERAALSKQLLSGAARLITITGMGGMGKTSLAKRVALDLVAEFPDGVRFVECEAVENEEELLAALAGSLGVESLSVSETGILESLSGRQILLVFDCLERIVTDAGVLPRILRAEPGVKILVTSRVLLGAPFEQEFTLNPMPVKKGRTQTAEGIELFLEAAASAAPNIRLGRPNQKLVEEVVKDLQGVPLAIVLAAGRLRHMSLAELQSRIRTQKLDVLKRTPRTADDKHSDLIRVVRDSLDLLVEEDRMLVKTLSVFQGGFFQDDARAVLGDSPGLLDGISLLRDHSFLMTQVVNARMRFRILDTTREYLDRIPDDEMVKATRERHSRHFAAMAATIRTAFDAGRYGPARELLALDIGNYRAGVQWAISKPDRELVRQYARTLARVYFETGAQQEFELLGAAAESMAGDEADGLMTEIFGLQGEAHRRNNRLKEAISVWQRKADLCRRLGDLHGCADTLLEIARLAARRQDDALVQNALQAFADLRGQIEDPALVATGIAIQAEIALDRGRPVEALALCRELEELIVSVPADRDGLYPWASLAKLYRLSGRYEDAIRVAYRCLESALDIGHLMAGGFALLEISRNLESLANLPGAARAIAIASLIPAKQWPSLAEQVSERRRGFENGGHGEALAAADNEFAKRDWQLAARAEIPADP